MIAWQVCPQCGAVTYIWRDYDQRRAMVLHEQIHASMLNNPDGSPCIANDPVRCQACGRAGPDLFSSKWMRTGEDLP